MLFSGKYPTVANATSTSISIGICAGLFVASILVFQTRRRPSKNEKDNKEDAPLIISHQLAPMDATFYMLDLPPITTLTWFHGDFQAARPHLQTRMKLLMAKNPWLQGRISVQSYRTGTCHLSYPDPQRSGATMDGWEEINIEENLTVIDPTDSPLSHDMPLSTQNKTILQSDIYTTDIFLKNGPKEPLFKATLVPCSKNPDKAFALVVQFSHVVGDGATYYKLMQMLCSTGTDEETFVELFPERIRNSTELRIAVMGKEEQNYLSSWGFMCQNIVGLALNKIKGPLAYDYSFVDAVEMEAAKVSAAKEAGVPFVSTNDVLTSWLMTQSARPYGMMALNWRNRLAGHTDRHAGNYEDLLFYEEEDYASPGFIRQSLECYKRVVTKEKHFPSWWEIATAQSCFVSNWASFARPNVIEGCEEDIHFPLILADLLPTHRVSMNIIFRAGMGKVGLCYSPDVVSVGTTAPFMLKKEEEGIM